MEAGSLNRALGNLLANAEEALPNGGTISIAVGGDDRQVRLTFADDGCGRRATPGWACPPFTAW